MFLSNEEFNKKCIEDLEKNKGRAVIELGVIDKSDGDSSGVVIMVNMCPACAIGLLEAAAAMLRSSNPRHVPDNPKEASDVAQKIKSESVSVGQVGPKTNPSKE